MDYTSYERSSLGLSQVTVLDASTRGTHTIPLPTALCALRPGANATFNSATVCVYHSMRHIGFSNAFLRDDLELLLTFGAGIPRASLFASVPHGV